MLMFPVRSVMIAAVAAFPILQSNITPAESVAINLTRKERAKIKQYIAKERIGEATVKEIVVGSVLAGDVLLRPPPALGVTG